jgi:hypothetical protein
MNKTPNTPLHQLQIAALITETKHPITATTMTNKVSGVTFCSGWSLAFINDVRSLAA